MSDISAVVSPEIESTHADRPSPRIPFPFDRLAGRPDRMRWFHKMRLPPKAVGVQGDERIVPYTVDISDSPYADRLGSLGNTIDKARVLYDEVCGKVDGLLAKVDALTTENVMLKRKLKDIECKVVEEHHRLTAEVKDRDIQIAALQKKLEQAERGREKGPDAKGRKQVAE